ncbi:MAG TPA: hypothetical protein VKP14_10130 [Gaiellaceae bacterium]|nr:hypothetical protein [Gaiellaceae bacterium]
MSQNILQDLGHALIKSFIADADIARHQAVKFGIDEAHVTPAGANDGALGFSLYDVKAGQDCPVHLEGGVGYGIAAGAIPPLAKLVVAAGGHVTSASDPPVTKIEAGLVPAANSALLVEKARQLVAVNVTAAGVGKPTGPYAFLPRGTAPAASGQCSLHADGTKVDFLAGDGVAAVDVEYEPLSEQNVVATALGVAAEEGDLIPILINRESKRGQ